MTRIFFFVLCCICFCQATVAQYQKTFDVYRQEAGEYASLFRGKLERGYPSFEYANHPYWSDDSFSHGDVLYNGLLYTNLSIRFDTFLNQLIVRTPNRNVPVWVDMSAVAYFTLEQLRFVRQGETFVALHYDSPRVKLVQRAECTFGIPITKNGVSYKNFKRTSRYWLQRGDESYEVKSLSSVLKHFPSEKKLLKQFAKEQHLNFKEDRAAALTALIGYADRITQP